MHVSLSTHLCGGEISAVKLSFTHELATCGMCADEQKTPTGNAVSDPDCCKTELSYFSVDHNYSPSLLQIDHSTKQLLQVFDVPRSIGIQFLHTNSVNHTNVQPPGHFLACAVSLPDICVFRI